MQRYLMDRRADVVDALGACESPVEVLLALALLCAGDAEGPFLRLCEPKPGAKLAPMASGRAGELYAQYPAKLEGRAIRIDLALVSASRRLAIEVDGHAFHSSKAARGADASRDIGLVEEDWTPIRFTGTQVYTSPERCAGRVLRLVGLTPAAAPPEQMVIAAIDALAGVESKPTKEDIAEQFKRTREGAQRVLDALRAEPEAGVFQPCAPPRRPH
jgi:hypothetical protein